MIYSKHIIKDLLNRKNRTKYLDKKSTCTLSEGQDSALERPGQVQSENMSLESLQINKCAQTWATWQESHMSIYLQIYLSNLPEKTLEYM